jgi:hypothetical protein
MTDQLLPVEPHGRTRSSALHPQCGGGVWGAGGEAPHRSNALRLFAWNGVAIQTSILNPARALGGYRSGNEAEFEG